MSPEYAMGGTFSVKTDTYSFGVLLLEIVSGLKITSPQLKTNFCSLITYVSIPKHVQLPSTHPTTTKGVQKWFNHKPWKAFSIPLVHFLSEMQMGGAKQVQKSELRSGCFVFKLLLHSLNNHQSCSLTKIFINLIMTSLFY
jgi:hypothetical protein